MKADTDVKLPDVYEFGEFCLDVNEGRFTRNGEALRVPPRALELLAALVARAGRLVTKEELLAEVWADTFVEEGNLAVTMVTIRRLLGDETGKTYIETVPRRGYRFIAPVRQIFKSSGNASVVQPDIEPAASAGIANGASATPAGSGLTGHSHPAQEPAPAPVSEAAEVRPSGKSFAAAVRKQPQEQLKLSRARFSRARFSPAWLATACALLLAGIAAGHFFRQAVPPFAPAYRQITFRRGSISFARFSPDGTILYSANWDSEPARVYAMRPEYPQSRSASSPGSILLSVTPDGELGILRNAAYLHHTLWTGTLAKAPLDGGAPRDLLDNVFGADWDPADPTGQRVAVVRRDPATGAMRLEFPVGKVLYESSGWISGVRISPKGNRIAFLDHPLPDDSLGSVALVDTAGHRKILSAGWAAEAGLAWSPKGNEVWFSAARVGNNMAIYAVSLNGRVRSLLGAAGRITLHDVSRNGTLLISADSVRTALIFSRADGSDERDLSWLDHSACPHLSPDGKLLLFTEDASVVGPHYAACLRGTDGSPVIRLGDGTVAGLSPDGKWALAIISALPGQMVLLPTGAGETKILDRGSIENYSDGGWLPGGKRILFTGNEPARPEHAYIQDIAGGRPVRVLPDGYLPVMDSIAPDGRSVACRYQHGRYLLCPLDGGRPQPIAGLQDGEKPLGWTAAGRELYVADLDKLPILVNRLDPHTGQRTFWRQIMPSNAAGLTRANDLALTPDGQFFTANYVRVLSKLFTVQGVK